MAGNYNASIPSLPGLNDANAAALAQPAAGVVAGTVRGLQDVTNARGTVRGLQDVTNARQETRARKKLKRANNASVTDNEISEAVVRETAIAVEVSSGLYGAGGAPAWAAPLLGLPAQIADLTAQIAALTATDRARRRNHNIANDVPLAQLQKAVAGVGPPLPGCVASAPPPPNQPVGTPYLTLGAGGLAPVDLNELNNMTLAQISALAEWAHEDFEIVAGDNVAVQRTKLRDHYTV